MKPLTTTSVGLTSAITLSGAFLVFSTFSLASNQHSYATSSACIIELRKNTAFDRASSLFNGLRSMDNAEQDAYSDDLKKVFQKTGRNLFA